MAARRASALRILTGTLLLVGTPGHTWTVTPGFLPAAGGDDERAPLADTITVVAALVVLNVAQDLLPPGSVWLNALAAVALLSYARRCGLSWSALGLGGDRLRSGGRWAAGVVVAVAATYLAGVLLPSTRPAFLDSRYDMGGRDALLGAFVVIPLRTVLLEEVAFRSVLPGLLQRHTSSSGAAALSSALFGLWHVIPSFRFADARGFTDGTRGRSVVSVVAGTVVFTGVGGLVAGELRRRSGSVVASAGMHWATNALGLLFGVVARRLPG